MPNSKELAEEVMRRYYLRESAAEIARALGMVSRSAVAGLIYRERTRLGHPPMRSGRNIKNPVVKAAKRKPDEAHPPQKRFHASFNIRQVGAPVAPTPLSVREPGRGKLTLAQLTFPITQCRHIEADGLYCGDPVSKGSYCEAHRKVLFIAGKFFP